MSDFSDVAAFPLCWPEGWERTPRAKKQTSRFKVESVYEATQNLTRELGLMGAKGIILSTSIPLRRDGLPLSKPPVDGDHGAAVYFVRKGKSLCLACDQYYAVEDNIHAIAKTIEAMRGIERWGSTDLLDRAFTGFMALPSGSDAWWDVLGVPKTASSADAEAAYRRLAKSAHPDAGGSHDRMSALNAAIEQFRKGGQ